MEYANSAEEMRGDVDLTMELKVMEIPFSSPRRAGPVELLMAKETPT